MIGIVNYSLPIAGLLMCFWVMMTRTINTRAAICAAKLNLWMIIWIMLLWADWGSEFTFSFTTVVARTIAFSINVLDVKQLTVSRKPRVIMRARIDK